MNYEAVYATLEAYQKSGIHARVGCIQNDVCTAAEADFATRHFEDHIMTFQIACDVHTVVKAVHASIEMCDAGWWKIIPP